MTETETAAAAVAEAEAEAAAEARRQGGRGKEAEAEADRGSEKGTVQGQRLAFRAVNPVRTKIPAPIDAPNERQHPTHNLRKRPRREEGQGQRQRQ